MAKKNQTEETIVDVQEVYTKTEVFVDRNRKALTIGLAVVALVVIGFFAYQKLLVEPQAQEAQNNIWQAQMYFEQDSMDLALNGDGLNMGFEEITAEFSGTATGNLAHYYAGIVYRDNGDYEVALDHFKAATDLKDNAISVIAMGNVGDMYAEMGEVAQAADWMEKTAKKAASSDSEDFTAPMYYYKAATLNVELENYSKALSLLEVIVNDYPNSAEYRKAAKESKALLRYL